jgi:hypothetical protein
LITSKYFNKTAYKTNGTRIWQRTTADVEIRTQKLDFKETFICTVAAVVQYMNCEQLHAYRQQNKSNTAGVWGSNVTNHINQ